ncbi:alpha-D-ribose 1-methylphosphonate 5-triphosphate diphosphatase [Bradyrhizobium sp. LHD-71]|uniref:alpha-D-ribose 1-methylphosphonate 5-triphosphate diphosphatase n=1 Tax=Bradyrhizobium sp. LHD-71 TaxID=3072141 RepID=UPI00280F3505|nr:alpha-D-ribose 1-methylphosphonate 5-triphosphate diphosphatase [Bradyrhizobium sp. LHD-71]MDQ8726534.1 alpha-D-ribose 1-methylphosphonate 5-triphosphate diphosphatase [Bradyrhizobium sp. LHD-71]
MTDILIEGGQSLFRGELVEAPLTVVDGRIAEVGGGTGQRAAVAIDARGLLTLPGIVDLHGDAFERQMMPRPGVDFPIDVALIDSDRQLIANGITTAFHGVTWSWEPGLRGTENAHALVDAVEGLRPRLAADTHVHLRHETFNLDAEATIVYWIKSKRISLLAFNDHMSLTVLNPAKPEKRAQMAQRTGLSLEAFNQLVDKVAGRAGEVPASIARLAAISNAANVPMLSHDDETPKQRRGFRDLGVRVAEFPVTEDTAREAVAAGEFTVLGAPNVVRGGSHTGWISATDMVRKGLCTILASDYYYPAMLLAAFRLVAENVLPLPKAWELISAAPAAAAGLTDRGQLATGRRADIILVDAAQALRPRIVAVIAAGKLVHIGEADRLSLQASRTPEIAAA